MVQTSMNIAVLSGKGGTGKTLLSVNMAAASKSATYIDCDVEEPNGYLFFKPEEIVEENVSVKIPEVNKELCSGCRKCVDFCKFNALAFIKKAPIVFGDICHSCGGCSLLCPENAITEKDKVIGKIEKGKSQGIDIYTGILNTGEVSGVPIIEKLLEENRKSSSNGEISNNIEGNEKLSIIDCPPGSACIVMESIKDADFCVLVAEPTAFGAHNLEMVYELVSLFGKPFGVVLNKCLDGENPSEEFCKEKGIKILGRVPFEKELGELNSNAKIAARESERYNKLFKNILETVKGEVQHERASYTER
ncbi:CobQ/CobB/MinD/ParA nucleotide binding domain protein [Peptacetobacter hiranonis DSM 13275]|uniref:CobQ/CobB/MinD/ParA nucleotide binding domain protein n=2 Tax=Peptacetobacter TaxID=2743582 RepID=B6G046_PEPHT|nr:CobQ/CobB/MinD/ParA nucleotide binding domain protein [Peptacetobacter hiranonis DSM 13275]QEK20719.1 Iron-sulfur cluster carrier protein [Peptacetobacter hiranonis]